MKDFAVCGAREGAQALISALNRLTVTAVKGDGVLEELYGYALALYEGSTAVCEQRYHAMTRALIGSGARRISGSLWKDYLIHLAVGRENVFSLTAAAGRRDDAIMELYRGDLAVLGSLMGLTDAQLMRMAGERLREVRQSPGARDEFTRLSTELWSGVKQVNSSPEEKAVKQPPAELAPLDLEWARWSYGEEAFTESYVADEALEEVYAQLMKRSWGEMAEPLWSFFSAYGSGIFLKYRLLKCDGKGLTALPDGAAAPLIGSLYEVQRTRMQDNAIRFMRGETAYNMLLRGAQGTGRSASVYALAYELPEMRLIRLCPDADMAGLMEKLSEQPLKFLLLMDDIEADSAGIRLRMSELCAGFAQPNNVLICGVARSGAGSQFPLTVDFPCLTLTEFTDTAAELISMEGMECDTAELRKLSVDYQVECRDRLTFTGAMRVAQEYKLLR